MNTHLQPFNMVSSMDYIDSILEDVSADVDAIDALGKVCDLLAEVPSPTREQLFVSIARLGCKSVRPLN
ncbi:MAG: hypothetical protein IT290_10290 [Deltaproteobacteria bacterium]|nr:hypothetical protein [Deltaproteobacteria bacterium]